MLFRMEGEVLGPVSGSVEGEQKETDGAEGEGEEPFSEAEVVVRDPRTAPGFRRSLPLRPLRTEFAFISYEHDPNSTAAPPTTVLITNFPALTPNGHLQRHMAAHGTVASLQRSIDGATGAALGMVSVRFSTVEEARRCVEREDGAKGPIGGFVAPGGANANAANAQEERRAVLDPEGLVLKALMKERERLQAREREEKRRKEREAKEREKESKEKEKEKGRTPLASSASTPVHGHGKHSAKPVHPSLPPNPLLQAGGLSASPARPPPGASPVHVHGRHPLGEAKNAAARIGRRGGPVASGVNAISVGNNGWRSRVLPRAPVNSYRPGRSPSPDQHLLEAAAARERKGRDRGARERARADAQAALAANGRECLRLRVDGSVDAVHDDDVLAFVSAFAVEKVLRDDTDIFVTFSDAGTARRAERVLRGQNIGHAAVAISVQAPPAAAEGAGRVRWDDGALVEAAQELVWKELRVLLEKDITDRVVATQLRRIAAEQRGRGGAAVAGTVERDDERPVPAKRDLKTLSFKKQKRDVEVEVEAEQEVEEQEEPEEEQVIVERPKKKRKKEVVKRPKKVVVERDVESEDEEEPGEVWAGHKRLVSEDRQEEEEPSRKKLKLEPKAAKKKTGAEKKRKASVDEVVLPDEYEAPAVTNLRLSPGFESSLSPSRSSSPLSESPVPRLPTPPPHVLDEGICEDDEDIYYAKLVLSGSDLEPTLDPVPPPPSAELAPFFRKHATGSARTEGFYKITHAEKMAYVTQYQARAQNIAAAPPVEEAPLQHVESSRSNRANARRRAQGLEEINQVQRAVALSKGETTANELSFKFNQLQTRKKHLRFARSPIHDWGLYAMERISRGEMVIEYVGEVIRAQVAEKREKAYERQGIGSSYLFRIDEDLVVDATKKGNLGRLINHSCDPNCTAKIITINGEKKIVIYAKQEIELGDEITYDYHFPFEQDKIPCLCGSAKCRGFLN
ncbi:hypothetical protein B0H15DRAFT_151667 [Mycena belliarum]|uniref:Histone-lysine N-methyltransferase, H3 lysine-4 specific n=1 Tax=Mycena belliarum TaxID=1033014 RepID=A0AAD6UCW2_9AGAR|nr:hypothetical protein B0H15DRAFT_151667 [Mycena belliae]